jgi:hypothetical protein
VFVQTTLIWSQLFLAAAVGARLGARLKFPFHKLPFERGHKALQEQTVRDPKYNNDNQNNNNNKNYLYLAATRFMTSLILRVYGAGYVSTVGKC